jgi:hypothetical protein
MKRVLLVLTAIALVFAVAGCGSGGAGGPVADNNTYKGTDASGNEFTLVITPARAASGDDYNLDIKTGGATVKSMGEVMSAGAGSIVCGITDYFFTVSYGAENKITNISGTIKLSEGGAVFRADDDWDKTTSNGFLDQRMWQTSGIASSGAVTIPSGGYITFTGAEGWLGIQVPSNSVQGGNKSNQTSASGTRKIVIEYIADYVAPLTAADAIKLTPYNGNGGATNALASLTTVASAETLKVRQKGTIKIEENKYTNMSSWVWFKKTTDADTFLLKILSVKWE